MHQIMFHVMYCLENRCLILIASFAMFSQNSKISVPLYFDINKMI